MKRTTTILAFSIAAILGSASAFAQTKTVTVDVVWNYWGGGSFSDDNLNSSNTPSFASISTEVVDGVGGYPPIPVYTLRTYIDRNNPLASNSNTDWETHTYSTRNYWGIVGWSYDTYHNTTYTREEYREGNFSQRETFSYYGYPDVYEERDLIYVSGNYYAHTTADGERTEIRDNWELVDSGLSTVKSIVPVSGVGIFDFEKSFVHYEDWSGIVSVSLADILSSGMQGGYENWGFSFDTSNSNFSITWQGVPDDYGIMLVGVTLAYNLPVPEPETWAMLLAGLGVVGAVARRRRIGATV